MDQSDKVKRRIREEFDRVLQLMMFQEKGHDVFRRWYVDGRLFYHKVIDKKNPRKGITELRYIDPQKIKKVREKILVNLILLLVLKKNKQKNIFVNMEYYWWFCKQRIKNYKGLYCILSIWIN